MRQLMQVRFLRVIARFLVFGWLSIIRKGGQNAPNLLNKTGQNAPKYILYGMGRV
jgi:hypothetical protein